MSSLKTQLATLAQRNPETGRVKNLSRRDSYIYSPSQAAKLTVEQVYQIGLDGFQQILPYDPIFQKFTRSLFAESSKRLDRTLLEPDEAQALKETIEEFLNCLGPYLLSKPSAHALEWLVRRFRINEFDVPTLLSIFLPYYDTPQFLAMLNITRLDPHPHLHFLLPVKKSRTGLPIEHFIEAIINSPELLRLIFAAHRRKFLPPSHTRCYPARPRRRCSKRTDCGPAHPSDHHIRAGSITTFVEGSSQKSCETYRCRSCHNQRCPLFR